MPGVSVYLDRPPRTAQLITWGRAPDAWWGCVCFRQPVVVGGARAELAVAAWVPAAALKQPPWNTSGGDVPRIELPPDRAAWPAPVGWPSWFAGVWPNGPLPLPPGLAIATGPAWRA